MRTTLIALLATLLIASAQNWGSDFSKWTDRGQEMPVACVYGWEPSFPFIAASPIPPDVSEYDVIGALRGEPVVSEIV